MEIPKVEFLALDINLLPHFLRLLFGKTRTLVHGVDGIQRQKPLDTSLGRWDLEGMPVSTVEK